LWGCAFVDDVNPAHYVGIARPLTIIVFLPFNAYHVLEDRFAACRKLMPILVVTLSALLSS